PILIFPILTPRRTKKVGNFRRRRDALKSDFPPCLNALHRECKIPGVIRSRKPTRACATLRNLLARLGINIT
uniref:Uncharacterized protein n=1 Tax=Romanomermis culicivorax TaxID=13658 RepID=A0A915KI09_ROMCU